VVDVPILRALDLGRRVEGDWLWRHVSFELGPGEVSVLRGPSGVGKSLLFRALIGLDHPDEGEAQFQGRPISGWPPPKLRARMLYCPQRPLIIRGTVRENLVFPRGFAVHGADPAPAPAPAPAPVRVAEAEQLFIRLGRDAGFLERMDDVLSGGEAQLVSLVRALLLDPTVLLLDEPTAGLDEGTALEVERVVAEWVEAGDRAVMWTSHDARQTERVRLGSEVILGGRK